MPKKRKRKLRAFLSYARPDKDKVRELYSRLKGDGVDVWFDDENLAPGLDWKFEIQKSIEDTDVVIFCLTKNFNKKGYRQKELEFALNSATKQPEGTIFIIPAKLEKCMTLRQIEKWQWVNLFEKDGYNDLLRALRIRAANIGGISELKQANLNSYVRDVVNKRPLTLTSEDTLETARRTMKKEGASYALVQPLRGGTWSIFTKTDLLIALSTAINIDVETLGDFSSTVIYEADLSWTVREAIEEMVKNGVSHLLVYDENKIIVGVVDASDIVYL